MSEPSITTTPPPHGHAGADGLWRWLVGGLVGGAVILGLLVAAYAIGYHRGQHHPLATARAAAARAPAATAAATAPTTSQAAIGPVTVTPDLVARGQTLYGSDGCSACHSLDGTSGAGPSFKGLAGASVTLDNGQTVKADDAYLERSLTAPDGEVVKGYRAGIMSAAVATYALGSKPDDIRALIAFVKSQR